MRENTQNRETIAFHDFFAVQNWHLKCNRIDNLKSVQKETPVNLKAEAVKAPMPVSRFGQGDAWAPKAIEASVGVKSPVMPVKGKMVCCCLC
mgnify:CR=1 FL=1